MAHDNHHINRLGQTIRKMAIATVDNSNPVNIQLGAVKSVTPLIITIDQRLELDEDFLILTERVQRYEVDLRHNHTYTDSDDGTMSTQDALIPKLVIREGLKVGDAVVLARRQGGQEYVVLDKVVDSL